MDITQRVLILSKSFNKEIHMKQFKGIEYVYIAIANAFGLDKLSWEERIAFGKEASEAQAVDASEPMLFRKALLIF